ncbi:MAG TPA: NAD(P)-dependent oxidoreductase [Candidatus Saccharimonadales bacterium]|nr:NAD(P)-dependent oxidoreductase [Candidatus Saccharimonadales bacterium]
MTTIGWIGLGAMGAPMSERLAELGHTVVGFDVDPRRVTEAERHGVVPVTSVREVAEAAGILVLMVATGMQADAALFGAGGAAAQLSEESVVVVMATVGPAAVSAWSDRLATSGIMLVDAPVSGGVERAGRGELLIMASGCEPAMRRVRPIFDALASRAAVVGPMPGDGQKFKLVNQLLCGVHIAAAAEALTFAEAMGLDSRACWELLQSGGATSFMFADRGARMVDAKYTEVHSALDIFVKDMGLVMDTARQSGAPAFFAAAAAQLYLMGGRAGLGGLDDSSIVEVYRGGARLSAAGANVNPPEPS